jgi:Ca-activated chloride channel family protein
VTRTMRWIVALALTLVLGLAAIVYPALLRGQELLHAEWQYPYALLVALLVPAVFVWGVWGDAQRVPRLRLGTLRPLLTGPAGARVWLRDAPTIARSFGLLLCIGAIARPLNSLRAVTTQEQGIDIVVALDLSGSMRAVMDNVPEDLQGYLPSKGQKLRPMRIDAAKAVLRDFISRRKTDRIGVVVFGSNAYVVSPPTLDYHLLDALVSRMDINLIDPNGTAIGDAIGTAAARLRRSEAKSKAVILLTDGDNRGGLLAPEHAAELANKVGAKIYSIQIGSGDLAEVQDGQDIFGQPRYHQVNYPVNPKLLRELASKTGGQMYVATDARTLQASFHDVLDKLEKTKLAANQANYEELYRYLLLPGVLLLALDALLRAFLLRRFP